MIRPRLSQERGYEDKGWLQTYHTFSFDTFYDPDFLGFHALRVLNENTVKGGKGFGEHSHKEMEIVTYVIEGVLEHRDSRGNTNIIRPEEVQLLSAGTGVVHSEYNLSHHSPLHFLQIWINPEQHSLDPSYSQRFFPSASKWGKWCLVASRNGREGSLRIHQDVDIYATILDETDSVLYDMMPNRHLWIQIVSGKFMVQETLLREGDGAEVEEESPLEIRCLKNGELLLFDLA